MRGSLCSFRGALYVLELFPRIIGLVIFATWIVYVMKICEIYAWNAMITIVRHISCI